MEKLRLTRHDIDRLKADLMRGFYQHSRYTIAGSNMEHHFKLWREEADEVVEAMNIECVDEDLQWSKC